MWRRGRIKCFFVHSFASEVQGGRIAILYNDLFVRYRVHWCVSEVQSEENFIVYNVSEVKRERNIWRTMKCVRGTGWNILLCTVMCVWGTRGWKYYCVQWCVCEVQCKGNIIMYIDVSTRDRVIELLQFTVNCVWVKRRKMLLSTVMCVCGTACGKCYFLQWIVSEV